MSTLWGVAIGGIIGLVPSTIAPFFQYRAKLKYEARNQKDFALKEIATCLAELDPFLLEVSQSCSQHVLEDELPTAKSTPATKANAIALLNFPTLLVPLSDVDKSVRSLVSLYFGVISKRIANKKGGGEPNLSSTQNNVFTNQHSELLNDYQTKVAFCSAQMMVLKFHPSRWPLTICSITLGLCSFIKNFFFCQKQKK
jgi:hypothetical protein